MAAIEVVDLHKKYPNVQALGGVSLSVEKGEVFGLLGRNGAGKSTLVKILLGIVKPTSGSAKLLDRQAGDPEVRRSVGFLPEDHRLPEYHSALSYMDFVCRMHGMAQADRRRRSQELLELVGLQDRAREKIRGYSKGMRQRLGLAQALVQSPQVLFLDEPTDGVDPVGRRDIRDLIHKLKGEGTTVFLNSHMLYEVEKTSDRVAIIDEGKIIREGGIQELTNAENVYEVRITGDANTVLGRLVELVGWARPIEGGIEVKLDDPASIDRVIDALRTAGVGIRGLTEKTQRLEDVFLRAVRKEST